MSSLIVKRHLYQAFFQGAASAVQQAAYYPFVVSVTSHIIHWSLTCWVTTCIKLTTILSYYYSTTTITH